MSAKGFISVPIIIGVLIALVGGGALFVFRDKLSLPGLKSSPSVAPVVGGQNGAVFKSEKFGLTVLYSSALWIPKINAGGSTYSDAVFSREKILSRLDEDFSNARYKISWYYTPAYASADTCAGSYVVGDIAFTTQDGTSVKGCKTSLAHPSSPHTTRLIEEFTLMHPVSRANITFYATSDEIVRESADVIFQYFEDIVKNVQFFEPSVEGLRLVEEASQPVLLRLPKTAVPDSAAQADSRDQWRISNIWGIQTTLDLYRKEFGDYPQALSPALMARYRGDKTLSDELMGGTPISEYRYVRCSKNLYHLGISLETNSSQNNPKVVGLAFDLDGSRLCPADFIQGADNQKCAAGDTGRYCLDVGPKEPLKVFSSSIEEISFYLKTNRSVPVVVTLKGNTITYHSWSDFVDATKNTPDYEAKLNARSEEIRRLQGAVLAGLSKEDFEVTDNASIDLHFEGFVTEVGLEKLRQSPLVDSITVDQYFKAQQESGFFE